MTNKVVIKTIIFQALDWKEFNECNTDIIDNDDDNDNDDDLVDTDDNDDNLVDTDDNTSKYVIKIFGRTLDDKSVQVKILNYTPHFYVELPIKWTEKNTNSLIEEVKNKNRYYKYTLISYDIVSRYKFRGFNDNKRFNYLRLIFNNSKGMGAFARTINDRLFIPGINKPLKLEIYESNIDSFLRFIHIRNLNACGWLEVKKYKKGSDKSTCNINIECDWKSISSYENQNLGGAPFKICSFDIECTSGDGSFPQAQRIEDKIIQIGSVFSRYGGDIYKRHIITLGSCDPIDDCEVISVNSEKELLLEWTKLILKEDPDILTGYNIWHFDEPYMLNRAKHPQINCEKLFIKLSKMYNIECPYIEKQLSSAALGDNFLRYIDTYGRVQIDLMKVVQRDYKLSKYSLDSVSENFIQEKIINYNIISPTQLEIESKNLHFLKVGNYVKIISHVELEYGLKEHIDNDEDDEDDYCDEKYRIISINGNKMIIENKDIKFTDNGIKELGYDIKWGLVKDDIKAQDIFRLQKGNSADRKIIAEYCIQDCVLVSRLLAKLDIITNSISMANVCHVPLYYLLIRGQGIKSLSLVSKKCRQKQYLIPILDKNMMDNISYEGATVFEPKTGFYQTYIPVLDYNSLYPNSIISKNISHETIVIDSQYDNLPNYEYYDVSYKQADGSTNTCRYAKHKDRYGILPEILQELLSERKATRKLMEKETDSFKRSILDGKQLALKVTANSLYGQLGASTSPICMKQLAASTTAIGREMLETARSFVEQDFVPILKLYYEATQNQDVKKIDELNQKYLKDSSPENVEFIRFALGELFEKYNINPHIIYGDSCTGDTPIILNDDSNIKIQTFNNFDDYKWTDYSVFKNPEKYMDALKLELIDDSWEKPSNTSLTDKQQINMKDANIKIWTHSGWAKINRIIRHKTNKKIYRVLTHNGCVDVTEDHSLLDMNAIQIKPVDCVLGQELLHSFPEFNNELINKVTIKEAYMFGFFMGGGSYEKYETEYEIKYKELFYDSNKCKVIPDIIYNASDDIKNSFIDGLYDSDGCHHIDTKNSFIDGLYYSDGCHHIDTKNKVTAQCYYYLLKSVGYNVSINDQKDKSNIFRLTWSKDTQQKNKDSIKQIYILHEKYNDYVYDIETEYGVFHAGIGSLIIKNTDSVFTDMQITFKENNNLLTSKEGLIHGIKLGQLASMFIKNRLPYPHNLEYEKTFHPFCIMAKKRYVGNKYEENPNKFKQSSMGIVLKRRDNANIVKKVIGGLVNIMMNENNIDKAVQYINTSIENLLLGNFAMSDFITTKTLRATYKGTKLKTDSKGVQGEKGTWNWDDVECSIGHVKLCQKIKARDSGNAPLVNERMPSIVVYVENKFGQKLLQGDIIEHPDYVKDNNLEVDYLFYLTNQIMNPAVQFLEHLIKTPKDIFNVYIKREETKRKSKLLNNFGGLFNKEIVRKDIVSLNKWLSPSKLSNDSFSLDMSIDPLELYDRSIIKKTIINQEKKPKMKPKMKSKNILETDKKLYFG